MVATRRSSRLYDAAAHNQVVEPETRPSRITRRRQHEIHNTVKKDVGLHQSTQATNDSMTRTTRQQSKRKASQTDLAKARPSKRSIVNLHEHCTNEHCIAFIEQALESTVDATQALNRSIMDVDSGMLTPATAPSTPTRGFLTLPREVRDEIYKHVLTSGPKRAVTLQNRDFITKSGLIGVNSQIKEEFLDALLFFAPVIHTTVRNHNFAHVVTFLNRLSEAQLHKLAAAATPNSHPEASVRSRKIIITLTYSRTKTSTKPQLNRWLDRFDDPKRRGAEVRIEYRLDRDSWQNGGYKQRPHGRGSAGPRSQEEVKKILEACRSPRWQSWW